MSDVLTKLATARAIVRSREPYLMDTIYGFIPYPVEGIGTMGVTKGMVLLVDGDWVVKLPDEEVAAALVHEAHHPLRDHITRGMYCDDKELANLAMDLAINADIRSAGWRLPHGCYPENFGFPEGLAWEEYYQLLKQQKQQGSSGGHGAPQQQPQKGQGKQQGAGQGSSGANGGGPPSQDQNQAKGSGGSQGNTQPTQGPQQGRGGGHKPQGQKQRGQGPGQSQGQGKQPKQGQGGDGEGHHHQGHHHGPGSGHCGGIAGNPISAELEQKVDAEMGRSDVDKKRIVKQTFEAIKAHASQHGRGSVPASLLQEITLDEQKNEVRWQDELAHVVKKATGRIEAGGIDFSLARPSKRSYARGFPRPGLVKYLPEIAFILDTSGSMGDAQIIAALKETISIFKTLGLDQAWFLQADAEVVDAAKRIRVRDLMGQVKIKGRGGTSFDPALRAIEKLNPKPDLAVYFTDGDGYVTHKPKGIEVIWCVVRGHYNRKPPCDWGHAIIIAEKSPEVPVLRR